MYLWNILKQLLGHLRKNSLWIQMLPQLLLLPVTCGAARHSSKLPAPFPWRRGSSMLRGVGSMAKPAMFRGGRHRDVLGAHSSIAPGHFLLIFIQPTPLKRSWAALLHTVAIWKYHSTPHFSQPFWQSEEIAWHLYFSSDSLKQRQWLWTAAGNKGWSFLTDICPGKLCTKDEPQASTSHQTWSIHFNSPPPS